MRDLLAELTKSLDQGTDCVYCSLVETRGSTPQKAGAGMLVFPDGSQKGTLGGGCVEAEVRQRALRVLAAGGQAEVLTFCLDDDYGWDDGLICGGRMTILADPLTRANGKAEYYQRYHDLAAGGKGCTEAVVIGDNPAGIAAGSRFLFDADGLLVGQLPEVEVSPPCEGGGGGVIAPNQDPPCPPFARGGAGPAPQVEVSPPYEGGGCPSQIIQHLEPLGKRPRPTVRQGVCYLPVLPRITLLIVGAGHVGQAVARLAAEVDFDVWVLDDRERYANRERFPTAHKLIIGDLGGILKELVRSTIHPSMYCIIVTRGHNHDEEALYHLATSPAGYVGMIGSKRKIKLIQEDLIAKNIPPEALARVHAPLGLPIGSQTVPEIAVSIVAELIACRNQGSSTLHHVKVF